MRTALAGICVLTLLAVVYLSLSLLILQPPRANMAAWFLNAAFFAAQSALTLTALVWCPPALRVLILVGSGGLVVAGFSAIRATLLGPHFEGYALVLGAMLIVQGLLTIVHGLKGWVGLTSPFSSHAAR